MTRSIRTNFIQTIIDDSGRLMHYRATLPMSELHLYQLQFNQSTMHFDDTINGLEKIKNRYYYTDTDVDFDALMFRVNQIRVKILDMKMSEMNARRTSLLPKPKTAHYHTGQEIYFPS